MKSLKIVIPLKPVSTNTYLGVNRRGHVYTSSEATNFQACVQAILIHFREDLKAFRLTVEKSDILEASYFFFIPKEIYYTLQGELSSQCYDWGNSIKVLQDCLFKFLMINDRNVKKAKVVLYPSDRHCISIILNKTEIKYKKSPRMDDGNIKRIIKESLPSPSKPSKVPRNIRGVSKRGTPRGKQKLKDK